MNLEEAANMFLHEMCFREQTRDTYRHGLRAFAAFARGTYHSQAVEALEVGCLEDFSRWLMSARGRGGADGVVITGKGERQRVLFLLADAQAAIRAYLQERTDRNPWLFVAHSGQRAGHIGRSVLWRIVKDAVRALGLDEGTSPHTFCHYRAGQLLNNGMPLESVQAFLGRRSIVTTRTVYADTLTATLREQVQRYSIPAGQAARERSGA